MGPAPGSALDGQAHAEPDENHAGDLVESIGHHGRDVVVVAGVKQTGVPGDGALSAAHAGFPGPGDDLTQRWIAGQRVGRQHIADRRLERIGLPTQYSSQNPFPWMSEAIDLRKEKNFFETRVTEYQTSGSVKNAAEDDLI